MFVGLHVAAAKVNLVEGMATPTSLADAEAVMHGLKQTQLCSLLV